MSKIYSRLYNFSTDIEYISLVAGELACDSNHNTNNYTNKDFHMMTKFCVKYTVEVERALDELGFIPMFFLRGKHPEYVDVGYAFFSLIPGTSKEKVPGIFAIEFDKSKLMTPENFIKRAKHIMKRYKDAYKTEEGQNWLMSEKDTWEEMSET